MSHTHSTSNYNRAFALGVILNLGFVGLELGFGLLSDSLALIADAGHNFSDVLSLLLAWGASLLTRRATTEKRTYGYRKATIMASLASSILLILALGGITWEALGRLGDPQTVGGSTVMVVAAIGVIINTVTALLFVKGQAEDLNIRAAFLHMAADAGVSLGVVLAGWVIWWKNWLWVDPVLSLIIVAIILVGTWSLLRQSLNYAMDGVPEGIDLTSIKEYLLSNQEVLDLHDLHVWPLSTTENAMTVHLIVAVETIDNAFLQRLHEYLHDHCRIEHATLQVESRSENSTCRLNRNQCL